MLSLILQKKLIEFSVVNSTQNCGLTNHVIFKVNFEVQNVKYCFIESILIRQYAYYTYLRKRKYGKLDIKYAHDKLYQYYLIDRAQIKFF